MRSPYGLYSRALTLLERGKSADALVDARALLSEFPGLGPGLELVTRAAADVRDYPLLVAAALELLERGWPGRDASARLRAVPREYFLPQDRVRWMQLDPRGSLEAVVRRLLSKGDLHGAALAARGGSAKYQPPELLPLLARVELQAGEALAAQETLAGLASEGAPFQGTTGLVLEAALATERAEDLTTALERVLSSGPARDPELVPALDLLLASGHLEEAGRVLAWLAPESLPFQGEVLLRQAAARALGPEPVALDEDLERAAALLEDGRPELGRLVLALEAGDEDGEAREARALLATPFARAKARRAVLLLLAGEPEAADELVSGAARDGRELLLELAAACRPLFEPAPPGPGEAARAPSPFLLEELSPRRLLVLGLAAEVPPWNAWVLARSAALGAANAQDPWVRALRAQCWLALARPQRALAELGSPAEAPDARLAWLRVRCQRAEDSDPEHAAGRQEAELAWLAASGLDPLAEPELAALQAAGALRRGARDEARRTLEAALERHPDDGLLLERLAEAESTAGRRTRAIELYRRALAARPERSDEPRVLALLDALRAARDEGEISEARWWAEVEALESERPEDPAPARVLAERAFEDSPTGPDLGRAYALQRLERLRTRTLGRALESLRPGEAQRWTALLARYTPERAVAFAEEELRRDPSDPALWRATANALLAAGRARVALDRLEALQRVAPELETARMLAVARYQLENDRKGFLQRVTNIQRFDPDAADDVVLSFYRGLAAAFGKEQRENLLAALALWRGRAQNGLTAPEHGRALALSLFEGGMRAEALEVLADTYALANGALQRDVFTAMSYLMRAAPAVRPAPAAEPETPAGPDDAPARKPEPAAGKAKGKGKAGATPTKANPGDGATSPRPGASPGPRKGDAKQPPAGKKPR